MPTTNYTFANARSCFQYQSKTKTTTSSMVIIPSFDSVTKAGPLKGYKQLIARHANATTGLSGTRHSIKTTNGRIRTDYFDKNSSPSEFWVEEVGYLLGNPGFYNSLSVSAAVADNLARAGIYRKLRAKMYDLSGTTFLAEFRETIRMIKGRGLSLVKGINSYLTRANSLPKQYRTWQRMDKRRKNKILSSLWLEYAFGWRPLISDIAGGINAIVKLGREERFERFFFIAGDAGDGPTTVTRGWVFSPANAHLATTQDSWEVSVKYYGAIRAKAVVDDFSGFASRAGFDWLEVLPTIYEVVPYSFLVDYVSNLGQIINASVLDTTNIAWIARGEKKTGRRVVKAKADISFIKQNSAAVTNVSGFGGEIELLSETVNRTGVVNLGVPSLTVNLDRVGGNQLTNAAALLLGRSKSISNRLSAG